MCETRSIKSVGSFLDDVILSGEIRSNSLPVLFRGQEYDWPLLPQLARGVWDKNGNTQLADRVRNTEREMRDEFRNRAGLLVRAQPRSDLEWLAIARHHGLPTFLLDWTENPLIGLWFAVRRSPDKDKKPVVWGVAFNDRKAIIDSVQPRTSEAKGTTFFRAPLIHERPAVQAAWFSLHTFDNSADRFVPLEEQGTPSLTIYKFELGVPEVQIREQLCMLGVDAASVFPGLDGISESLGMKHVAFCMP